MRLKPSHLNTQVGDFKLCIKYSLGLQRKLNMQRLYGEFNDLKIVV